MVQPSVDTMQLLATNTIYLIGGSFMLGSLFTLLLLALLDLTRASRDKDKNS